MMLSGLSNFLEQKFFNAAKEGNLKKMLDLLNLGGVSITAKAPFGGKQALHIACEARQKAIVEKLIELGADIQATTDRGFTPLHIAAQQGDETILMALIRAGADVNALTDNGMGTTPLQEAAHNGHLVAINILITAGGDTQYRERKYNLMATDLARQAGHPDILIALLGYKKAFIQRVNNILISWATVFLKNTPQYNYYLSLNSIPEASDADDYFRELKIKLEQGYQPIKEDVQKLRSTIITAMKQYNADKLLEQKIKSILPSKAQHLELSDAVSKGIYSQVEEALAKGEDANQIVDTQGNTALLVALKWGFYEIAKLLIIKGADIWKENKYGEDAMSLCPFNMINEVISESSKIKNFLNNQQILNSLWRDNYQELEDKSRIKTLLEMDCNLEEKNIKGDTPLLKAARDYKTFQSHIELLIHAGADTTIKDNKGSSLEGIISHLPIKKINQKKDVTRKAIEEINNAKKNKKLLILAVSEGLYNRARVAILNQEDVNQYLDKNLNTPLMIALKNGYWRIAKLLIENGASITMKNKQGMTAVDIAYQMNIPKIVTDALFANTKKEKILDLQKGTSREAATINTTEFSAESNKDARSYSSLTTLWKQPKTSDAVESDDENVQNNPYENLVLYYSVLNNIK